MAQYEYMILPVYIIPQDIIDEYQIMNKVKNGFIVCEIRQGMYGLPKAWMIANKIIIEIFAKHGYRTCELTPGLWKHDTNPVIFCITVNDFGVKYVGK